MVDAGFMGLLIGKTLFQYLKNHYHSVVHPGPAGIYFVTSFPYFVTPFPNIPTDVANTTC